LNYICNYSAGPAKVRFGVISGHSEIFAPRPLYRRKRTFESVLKMSLLEQQKPKPRRSLPSRLRPNADLKTLQSLN
jgi:hypothetical protein